MPEASRFTRKGAPDGGVESFWTLPNGEEWAWQAKFFFKMQIGQWRDLDESVRRAIEKHPRMVRYYVCLPINFADPRLTDRRSGKREMFSRDAWNARLLKWEQFAAQAGMQVRFEFWGEHEIWNRLTKAEHSGRLFFWFHARWFGEEWLRGRVEDAHNNAGKRYLPALHVGLDLERAFDGLAG
jgi:hypothetical protein